MQKLATDHEVLHNYAGVESDPEAMAIIDGHVALGRLKEFGSHEAQSRFVDGHPVPNKFACITKLKPDGSATVTDASRKMYPQVLPRQTDLVNDILVLQSNCMTAEEVELFVQDAEDAYWQIPLDPCLLYTSPSPRDLSTSRMPSSA